MKRRGNPVIRAISSAGERCLHTAEVTGSNPASPTTRFELDVSGAFRHNRGGFTILIGLVPDEKIPL